MTEPTTDQLADAALHRELERIQPLRDRAAAARPDLARSSNCAEDVRSELGLNVPNLTSLKLAAAGDHLHAVEALIRKDAVPTWAHYSLLRVATEAAIDVRWLLEPVASAARIGRAVGRMRYDFEERQKAESDLRDLPEWPPAELVDARAHIDDLTAAAKAAGVAIVGYPGTSNLASTMALCGQGMDGWNFRYLSGAIHSMHWAAAMGDVKPDGRDDDGDGVNIQASSTSTWYAVRCAVRHFEAAVIAMEQYVGHSPGEPV